MSYRPPGCLAHVHDEADGVLYLAHLPDGAPLVLQGSAALIWLAATGEPRPDGPAQVTDLVARETGLAAEDLREDVETFLRTLVEQGLLEERA